VNRTWAGTQQIEAEVNRTMSDKQILDEYARYKYLVDNIKDVIWELDKNFVFTFISPTAKGLSGYDAGQLVGQCMLDFLTDKSKKSVWEKIQERMAIGSQGDSPLYDVEFVCKDGHIIWCEVCVKPIFRDGALICYIGTTRDISEKMMYEKKLQEMLEEQKRINGQLENMATFDMLTGAYNRRKFEYFIGRETEKAIQYGTAFSISIFDIDDFKQVNDVYGHIKGDRILQDITALIKRTLRATDRLFRWGGDEFIALFPDTGLKNALVVANKIKDAVQACIFDADGIKVTVSLGVGSYDPDENTDQFVARVDKALLQAKNDGKDTVRLC
jgi:diguanylate cyclase (GGDEF)-like protein/PAS domain S-box-containing protein